MASSFLSPFAEARFIVSYKEPLAEQRVLERLDGWLYCEGCNNIWCKHVEQTIRDERDAVPTGSAKSALAALPDSVSVPVFPTEGIYFEVDLSKDEDFREVVSRVVTLPTNSTVETLRAMPLKKAVSMGFIGPGEARLAIRRMIIEWLRSQYRNAPSCKAPIHKTIRWSMADKRTAPIAASEWPQLVSLISTGMCFECSGAKLNFEDDAPVLSTVHSLESFSKAIQETAEQISNTFAIPLTTALNSISKVFPHGA